MKVIQEHLELAEELKNKSIIIDIETWSEYDIKSNFDMYVKNAICRWIGMYSYITDKYYNIQVTSDNKDIIKRFIEKHDTIISFNGLEFDVPILKNNQLLPDKKFSQVDLLITLGNNKFRKHKNRGFLMGYKFKENTLKHIAQVMNLETKKGDIDYKIFKKPNYTEDEKKEIVKYLQSDIEVTKQMFEKTYAFWLSFVNLLDKDNIKKWSHLNSSIASLVYKSVCNLAGLKEEYADVWNREKEEIGGRVIEPRKIEARDVWYLDVTSLYPHMYIMFNLFDEIKSGGFNGNEMFKCNGCYNNKNQSRVTKVLYDILKERIRLKKEDPDNPMVYALKIIINTSYGCSRSKTFKSLYTPNAGVDCCLLGQQIHRFMEEELKNKGYDVIAGDSVTKDTRLFFNYHEYETMENVWNDNSYKTYYRDGKEIKRWQGGKILAQEKNKKPDYYFPIEIIRHKVSKKIYKITLSNKDTICVTQDHSLIDENFNEVKPLDAKYVLYCNSIPQPCFGNEKRFDEYMYDFLGMITANGNISLNKKMYYCSLSFEYMDDYFKYVINNILEKYKIRFSGGKYKKTDYKFYNNKLFEYLYNTGFNGTSKTKRIPKYMFYETKENIASFIRGYFTGDGSIISSKSRPDIRVVSVNKKLLEDVRILLFRLGISSSLFKGTKENTYKGKKSGTYCYYLNILNKNKFKNIVGFSCDSKIKRLKQIKHNKRNNELFKKRRISKIEEIEYDDYVYDVCVPETNNFYANNILVHNTDGLMCSNSMVDKQQVKQDLQDIRDKILSNVPFPAETFNIDIETGDKIEYMMWVKDKVSNKFLKKNYVYIYKKDGKRKVKVMGLPIKKSNSTKLGKIIFEKYLYDKILKENKAKFSSSWISEIIKQELSNHDNIENMAIEYNCRSYNSYQDNAKGNINAQISKHYLGGRPGRIKLIKNKKIGKVGNNFKYCSIDEARKYKLSYKDLDLTKIINELQPFTNDELIVSNTKSYF